MNLASALLITLTVFGVPGAPPEGDCDGTAGAYHYEISCDPPHVEHANVDGTESGTENDEATSLRAFDYLWLPNCPDAQPEEAGAASIDCLAAHSCDDPKLRSQSLWAMQLTDARGEPVDDNWEFVASECRDPSATETSPEPQRRTLTSTDILSALRRIGLPTATVEAPTYTLVNLQTTFYTEPQTLRRSLTLIGYDVDVQATPSRFTWHWGDGTTTATTEPGRPYPATDITHTYTRATDRAAPHQLSVDVTYTARYRVDSGPWQTIPDTITIPGPSTDLPIKQASAVLTAQD